jgi:hypothetical protein
MGFLSAYSGTQRITIGDPDRGYWVELREMLSQGAKEKAEQALQGRQRINGGDVITQMDVARYRQLMVLASVKDWNLDDDGGKVWPINLQSVQRLPGIVFDELWKFVDSSNEPRPAAEQRRFPGGSDDGSEDGSGRSAESGDVLDGAPALDEAWAPSGGPGEASLA